MNDGIHNAVIEAATLRIERGFILDSWVHVHYGACGQGFGGFALYLGKTSSNHTIKSPAGHWLYRVMEIAGVEDWQHLKGKAIRVRMVNDRIEAIGHIIKDDWFCPSKDFEQAKAAAGGGS